MRLAVAICVISGGVAAADTFGGFSGVDRPYLIGADRVCQPLAVEAGVAKGAPSCEKATADVIAKLSVKPGVVQSGAKATFAATASGKVITVARADGGAVVTWEAMDPIGKIVEVYASAYEDRVAVAYTVRRLGKEVTDVVVFELVKTTGRDAAAGTGAGAAAGTGAGTGTAAVVVDPKLTAAIDAAKKAPTAKALAAWQAVLAVDDKSGEALYRVAALHAGAKRRGEALDALGKLAASDRADAIEWLVDARFDAAFAALRADKKFRDAVGLDRPARSGYERVMGFGGQWEQTGTSCDKPEVKLVLARDRSFKLRVKTVCEGMTADLPFHGTWRLDGDTLVLVVPTKGQKASAKDEAPCAFQKTGDEDALRCKLDRDLEFTVMPARR